MEIKSRCIRENKQYDDLNEGILVKGGSCHSRERFSVSLHDNNYISI